MQTSGKYGETATILWRVDHHRTDRPGNRAVREGPRRLCAQSSADANANAAVLAGYCPCSAITASRRDPLHHCDVAERAERTQHIRRYQLVAALGDRCRRSRLASRLAAGRWPMGARYVVDRMGMVLGLDKVPPPQFWSRQRNDWYLHLLLGIASYCVHQAVWDGFRRSAIVSVPDHVEEILELDDLPVNERMNLERSSLRNIPCDKVWVLDKYLRGSFRVER